jgi:hypothetical protein
VGHADIPHTRRATLPMTAPALSADRGHTLTFRDIFTIFFLLPSLSLLCRRRTASGGRRS